MGKIKICLRILLFYLIGSFYSVIIFYFSIDRLENVELQLKSMFFFIMLSLVSVNMAMTTKLRCIMTLIVFNIISSSGKLITTKSLAIDITNGPIDNTFKNTQQVLMSIKCHYNLYKKVQKISKQRQKRKKNFFQKFKIAFEGVKQKKASVMNLIGDIKNELGQNQSQHRLINYLKKNQSQNRSLNYLDEFIWDYDFETFGPKINTDNGRKKSEVYYEKKINQCKEIFKSGNDNCQNGGAVFKKTCEDNKFWINICSNLEKSDHCNMEKTELKKSPQEVCQDQISIKDYQNLDNDLDELNSVEEQMKNLESDFQIDLQTPNTTLVSNDSLYKVKSDLENVKHQGETIFNYINKLVMIIELLTNFSYSLVIINSLRYNQKYLKDISFDNFFLTKYFNHIDKRRKEKNLRTLLPLKKHENDYLFNPFKFSISAYQKPMIKINMFLYGLFFIFLFNSVLIDFFLYDFLVILKDNMIFDAVPPQSDVTSKKVVEIKGEGFAADFLRSSINQTEQDDTAEMNELKKINCVPHVSSVGIEHLYSLLRQIIFLIVLILIEMYCKRMNRIICGYFYPKTEKQRVLWLYNNSIKNRVKFKLDRKKKINEMAMQGTLVGNKLYTLKKNKIFFPLVWVLENSKILKKICIICDDNVMDGFWCKLCRIDYCNECWDEFDRKCVACQPKFSDSNNLDLS